MYMYYNVKLRYLYASKNFSLLKTHRFNTSQALLECEFMHSIDAPSLAILVPILGRALRDRGADLKRKSSAITGTYFNIFS